MKTNAGLENEYGQSVALKSVHLDGRIEGLLLTMKVRQGYLNDSEDTIEASYTFPAGWGANLMSFSVELNGKRMQAVALEKKKAEKKYENAIEEGDTPVMLEKSPLGLYTANLGNLKVGESAVIEIEYAQLLKFESGRLRVTVPTVIGQRYGDEVEQGYIAPHQGVDVDALVEYPFTARIDVLGTTANGVITCPSHQTVTTAVEGGKRIELTKGGMLDRDFVLSVDELDGVSFALAAVDEEEYAVVASFCPKLPQQVAKPLALKILVDCSGSMAGESIEQAQEALHELSLRLSQEDAISYSKFGSTVVHTSSQLEKCTPKYLKNVLAKAIHDTRADLGGTELEKALTSTFKLSFAQAHEEGCDLLLITDGDVWDIDEIVTQAKRSNHRIFAIGVGSAPAESLLRDLAEQTGGSCELVTPNESIADSVLRMTKRMRSARTSSLSINWHGEVTWQASLPKQVFADETVHVFAKLKNKPESAPVMTWSVGESTFKDSPNSIEFQSVNTIPRLTAGVRLLATTDEKEATQLALKYQLASKYTNLLLVHIRAEEEKADGLPTLQKINQMQAAGWGGFGKVDHSVVLRCVSASYSGSMSFGHEAASYSALESPAVWRGNRTAAAARVDSLSAGGMDDYEIPDFLRKQSDSVSLERMRNQKPLFEEDDFTPEMLLEMFNELSLTTTKFTDISWELTEKVSSGYVWEVLGFLVNVGGPIEQYWACLINWLSHETVGIVSLTRHSQRLLNAEMAKVTDVTRNIAEEKFRLDFPGIQKDTWGRTTAKEKASMKKQFKKLFGIS